jgi:hypothetical protein
MLTRGASAMPSPPAGGRPPRPRHRPTWRTAGHQTPGIVQLWGIDLARQLGRRTHPLCVGVGLGAGP